MIVSGYIFLPLFALPTLWVLKKPLQLKLLFFLVGLIHLMFGLGLLTRHGYLFEGRLLQESLTIVKDLGLNYTVSFSGPGLLMGVTLNFLFMLFGTVNFNTGTKKDVVLMTVLQPLGLLVLFSENILLTVCSLFVFLILTTGGSEKGFQNMKTQFAFIGFILLLIVSLVLAVLFESVHSYVDLDIVSLTSMRTPFVKGSLYSTQFVLAGLFLLGCLLMLLISLHHWGQNFAKKKNMALFWTPILLCVLTIINYFPALFPEVHSVYFSGFRIGTWLQWLCALTFVFSVSIETLSLLKSFRRLNV